MLGAMRKFTKSWVAILLIGLLVIAFAVFGVESIFTARTQPNVVAQAGDRELSAARFKMIFDNALRQEEQRAQRPIAPEEAAAAGLDQQILNQLAEALALNEIADRLGIRVGKELFERMLSRDTAFFDQITGKFDPATYARLLGQSGMTPAEYREVVTDQLAQDHMLGALGLGFEASRSHVAAQAAYAMQSRDAEYLLVDPSKVERPAAPTDAQLQAYLTEVSAQVTIPEMRELTIVRFSSKAIAPTVTVTPEEIQQVFDFRKDQLAVAEVRTIVQVPAQTPAMAATIADRLSKGEDPAAVAQSQGVQIVTYTDRPKSAIADRKVADVAFSLAEGQTSGPIAGDLGQAVVKVTSVTPGKTVTLDSVRPQIEEEARTRAAENRISDMADRFETAIGSGTSVAEAARAVGLTPIVTPPLTARGQSEQPATGLSAKLLETAFDLPQGSESELVQDEEGEYFIVHVNRVIAPRVPSVDELRGPLTQNYMARELERRVKALADQLAERVRKGETIAAVASSAGVRTGSLSDVTRLNAQQHVATVGQGLLAAVLGAKANEVVVSPGPGGALVAKVGAISNGEVATLAQMTNQARGQITSEMGREYQQRIGAAARDAVEVKLYPDNAKRAIGVTPAETTGAGEGKAG